MKGIKRRKKVREVQEQRGLPLGVKIEVIELP